MAARGFPRSEFPLSPICCGSWDFPSRMGASSMIWTLRCLLQRLETLRETLRIQLRRRRVTYLLKRRHLRRRRPRRLVQYQQKPKNRLTLTNQHPPRLRVIPIPRAYQADRCRRLRAHLVLVRKVSELLASISLMPVRRAESHG